MLKATANFTDIFKPKDFCMALFILVTRYLSFVDCYKYAHQYPASCGTGKEGK
jgi:hypothetical protein